MNNQKLLEICIFATLVMSPISSFAGQCGDYPKCIEGSICVNGKTYVCGKQNNSCGPWSTIPGCPKNTTSDKEDVVNSVIDSTPQSTEQAAQKESARGASIDDFVTPRRAVEKDCSTNDCGHEPGKPLPEPRAPEKKCSSEQGC
ncbi:MAG TPA: hypothetical protein HPP94_15050 [Desulfuromonadales bacterium]|nr:hypothetical protein [Desulfuromonadales bacterium]